MTDTVKLLSDDEVAELQARPSTELGGYRRVLLRPRERDALCATVRALRKLLDSQVAEICPTCKSSERDIRHLGCNGSYGVLHDNCGSEPCPDQWHVPGHRDAATRMRDRCVEKVKKLRETYRAGARTANAEERNRDQLIFLHKANAMTDAVNELQSLTLEQREQEKSK